MYLTNPAAYGGSADSDKPFRPLLKHEKIGVNDVVEDISTGERVKVKGSFYSFLVGQTAGQARQLPSVFDVVRP